MLALSTLETTSLVEVASGKEVRTLTVGKLPLQEPRVFAAPKAIFSSHGAKLYACSGVGGPHVQEWDVATGKLLRVCPATIRDFTRARGVELSPDEKTLILQDDGAQFFDLSGKDIRAVNRPAFPMRALHFTTDGKNLLGQSSFRDIPSF